MQDYQGNAKKDKVDKQPEKKIERVVASEVIVQKKSLGRKIKDTFTEADFGGVVRYVVSDVMIPAAKNLIVDATHQGIQRMMYGDSIMRRRNLGGMGPSRITYNAPVNRGYTGGSPLRGAPPVQVGPRSVRPNREDFVISSREEAELVLERMNDIIDQYEVVSIADLNELVGFPSSHVDNKWGWLFLGNVQIRQIREGYLIDLPPAEPIQ